MKNWYKRFNYYFYTETGSDRPPLISFSLDFYIWEIAPMVYFEVNDTNRWRGFTILLKISAIVLRMDIPFKKIEDYVPNKFIKTRRRNE